MHGNWAITITRHKKRATGVTAPEAQQNKLIYTIILSHQGGKEYEITK
ncbi:hypothetical protein [Loigolactobacillus backii]|nr:hypothetical protein [Loigolactobacillus backii]